MNLFRTIVTVRNSYTLSYIKPFREELLGIGTYLLLQNVYHKPPHIALLVEGKYYSLSLKGPEAGKNAKLIFRNIHIRRTPSLFVQLKKSVILTNGHLDHLLGAIVRSYPALDTGIATCLNPVKDFCHAAYGTETKDIHYVFELLPRLERQHIVGDCYGLYMHEEDHQSFSLLTYDLNDINNSIRKGRLELLNA